MALTYTAPEKSFIEGAHWLQRPCVARRCEVDTDAGALVCIEVFAERELFFILDDRGQGTKKVLNGGTRAHQHDVIENATVKGYLPPLNMKPGTEIPNRLNRRAQKKLDKQRRKRHGKQRTT
jgi:hypothetical protein